VLAWLSVWSEVQLAYVPADATATHCLLLQIGFAFLVPAHLGGPGERAVKRVCVCVCVGHTNKMSETPVMSDSLCVRQACMSCGRLADTEVIRRAFLSTSPREFLHWCHRGRASTEFRGSALCLSAVLSLNKAVVDYRLRRQCCHLGVTLSTRHFLVAIYAGTLCET